MRISTLHANAKRAGMTAIAVLFVAAGCSSGPIASTTKVPGADAGVILSDGQTAIDGNGTSSSGTLKVTAVNPSNGPFVGGATVQIRGQGFTAKSIVKIGGKAIQVGQQRYLSPIRIQVRTPAGKVGPADVEVTEGASKATLRGGYVYDPISMDPASGPTVGGTLVTIESTGTDFVTGMKATLGGKAITDIKVISKTKLTGKTPAGATGRSTLILSGTKSKNIQVNDAFLYYSAANPLRGGLGGGKVSGTLTITVLDWLSRGPVAGATVYVEKGRTLSLKGTTDSSGVKVFTGTNLAGPLQVTAGAKQYETTTIVDFDARDATIWLYPIIPPSPGGLPPGIRFGQVSGYIQFGGTTGTGSKLWKIVPEPKAGQEKRAYVLPTSRSLSDKAPKPVTSATITFKDDGKTTAWPYSMFVAPGNMAFYALAGLYTKSTQTFVPYAMGVLRGVVVGPGDTLKDKNIVVRIPLTDKVDVEYKDIPPEPVRHEVLMGIDLGADGIIQRADGIVKAAGVPKSVPFSRMPAFHFQEILDGAYTVQGTFTGNKLGVLPRVIGTERSVRPNKDGKIIVDKFVGVPKQVKPSGLRLEGNTLEWSSKGVANPDLAMTLIIKTDRTPVWRIISKGDVTKVQLPDPKKVLGLAAWPSTTMIWAQWLIKLKSYDFNNYNYSHLSSSYWSRSSFDQFNFAGPLPTSGP